MRLAKKLYVQNKENKTKSYHLFSAVTDFSAATYQHSLAVKIDDTTIAYLPFTKSEVEDSLHFYYGGAIYSAADPVVTAVVDMTFVTATEATAATDTATAKVATYTISAASVTYTAGGDSDLELASTATLTFNDSAYANANAASSFDIKLVIGNQTFLKSYAPTAAGNCTVDITLNNLA